MKLEEACIALKIPFFDHTEWDFLKEYVECMEPIALAMKVFESNKYTFSLYLPVFYGVRSKLSELKTRNFNFCKPLADELALGFETRFGKFMNIYESLASPYHIAMVTNPTYKCKYYSMEQLPSHYRLNLRKWLVEAATKIVKTRNRPTDEDIAESEPGPEKRAGKLYSNWSDSYISIT